MLKKIFNHIKIKEKGTIFAFLICVLFIFSYKTQAAVLTPGNISTCGELAISGTYTLTQNISNGSSTCLTVSSDNVTIDGAGFTISGTGDVAIDARVRTGGPSGSLTEGANAYTNLVLTDINVSGYTSGLNISGNSDTTGSGINNGYGGDAGDVNIYYSRIGNVYSNGGNSSTKSYGGIGGNITFNDTDLNISNSTISALGGLGTVNRNTNGGLSLSYTGTINKTDLILSALSFFNNNSTQYGVYVGGGWPLFPGNISTCGTLLGSGTYVLTQNVYSSSTCFTLSSNDISIDGSGYSILANSSSTLDFAINAGSFSNFTLASTSISNFTKLITSSSSVTISGDNIDISNTTIFASSLNILYTSTLNKYRTLVSALSSLIINGINYGSQPAGYLLEWIITARDSSRNWRGITSSADGTKLAAVVNGGQIYTSTDSGVTWTPRESNRNWYSITSSADGTKLAAVVYGGQIYTSTDSGVTWTARDSSRAWSSITSSLDGTKLAAVVTNGQIYTSTDSGVTWTARDSSRTWVEITSSSDGTKLAAVVYGGQIYTSTDSGVSWTARDSSRSWQSITSSADGTKLAAVVYGGQIYTSTDSGVTWIARDSSRNWQSITSSSDGTKLAAAVYNGGKIYTSTDSGVTWTPRESNRDWISITSSSDGTKLSAAVIGGQIYTLENQVPDLSVNILNTVTDGNIWNPLISWGTSVNCYYSYDNFVSTSTANCASNGSDISNPGYGSGTLYVKGIDTYGNIVQQSSSYDLNLPITITSPTSGQSVTTWSPSVDWDPESLGNITNCYYSYDNFVSTSTANCSLNGEDIIRNTTEGTTTLSLKVFNSNDEVGIKSVTFINNIWLSNSRDSSRNWRSITSSSDGTKLAAVINGGQIYTSTDSGVTWTARESNRDWWSITSSVDGTKLAAIVTSNGQIYTSTDSGVTWTARNSSRYWYSITSSADGTKLAAVVDNGQIYTSTDSGVTWTARESNRGWRSIVSSSDGTKLAAVVYNGQIYTSTDSGVSWTARDSSRSWQSITSSADGTKLAAVVYGGQIYTSTDSGVTWTARNSSRYWYSITSSADGTKLAAVVDNGQIYTSTDSGVTWTARESNRGWRSIVSSSDGTKLAAVVNGGQIYTLENQVPDLSVNILNTVTDGNTWNPYISWGTSVNCYYSYDNFVSTSTATCSSGGADISNPGYGSGTLYVKGIDTYGNIVQQNSSYDLNLPITITSPTANQSVTSWNPVIDWNPFSLGNITNCYYSYDNFTSTSTANCTLTGSDILPPSSTGNQTLYLRVEDSSGGYGTKQISFNYSSVWTASPYYKNWTTIDSSADGTKLVAGTSYEYVYTSTDSGSTWTQTSLPTNKLWMGVAISDDGSRIAAVEYGNTIYLSTTTGATWQLITSPISNLHSITMSSDGQKIAAVGRNGTAQVYISTDGGVTWASRGTNSGGPGRRGIKYSGDGSKLITGTSGGYIEISTNDGVSWATSTTPGTAYWTAFGSSYDGSVLVASNQYGGTVWLSTNGGTTWSNKFSMGDILANGLAVSDDGQTIVIADINNDQLRISRDGGTTWTIEETGKNWAGITSNTDGTKLAAAVQGGYVYTKNTNSSQISISRLTNEINILRRSWAPLINWGNSVLCMFSYNNFLTSTIVDCSNNGSDIDPPITSYFNTLYLRGEDSLSNQTNISMTFDYEPWTERQSYSGSVVYYFMEANRTGSNIVAVTDNSGPIYTSKNYGLTWTNSLTARGRGAAISDDGSNMLMAPYNGYIYRSTNGGTSWTAKTSSGIKNWFTVAMSADGTKAIAGVYGGRLYKSTNSGDNWSEITVAPLNVDRVWKSVIASDDFTKIFAAVSNGRVYKSTDSGTTWSEITVAPLNTNRLWEQLSASDDLTQIYGVVNNGRVYRSLDSGVTWEELTDPLLNTNRGWKSISVSGDGTKIYASVGSNGYVYVSEDSGTTWSQIGPLGSYPSIKVTADGTKVFVAENKDKIKIHTINSYPIISAPVASSSVSTVSATVNWDRSHICEYSYDNSNWQQVNCTGNGSDIGQPTNPGQNTLYVRGYDFDDNISTASVNFTYTPVLGNTITSCGNISSSGNYTLSGDISNVDGNCFTVNANNVTINGNGHTITAVDGNSAYAIIAGSSQNLILQDINFSGFGSGSVSSNSSVTYIGSDITLNRTVASALTITYTNTLNAVDVYISSLSNFIINDLNLFSWVSGLFNWNSYDITSCQTITNPGIYKLTNDIQDISGVCFDIQSNMVVIDGNNHTISGAIGNTDYAIVVKNPIAGYDNIGIKDLTITGFGASIDAGGYDGISGDVNGKKGSNISLKNVSFPTDTVSVNTKGGDGFFEGSTATGGDAGNVIILDSTLGSVIANGGNAVGDINIGYDNGTQYGGTQGNVSQTNSTVGEVSTNQGAGYIPGCTDNNYDNYSLNATYNDGTCTNAVIGIDIDNPENNTITGPSYFYGYSNLGIVEGDAYYDSVRYNGSDNITDQGNNGTTTGNAYFDDSWNYGYTPNNYGYIGGDAVFGYNYSGYNYGYNYGYINGNATFNNCYGGNYGYINGSADFSYCYSQNYGTVNGDATFYNDSDNQGTVNGNAYYYYTECSDPLALNYKPAIYGSYGTCYYYGQNQDLPEGVTYDGDLYFYGYNNYGIVNGTSYFYNSGSNYGTTTNAYFDYGSYNYGIVTGNAQFMDFYNTDVGGTLYVDGSQSFNGTGYVGGVISDVNNNPIYVIDFSNGQFNSGNIYLQTAFHDTSYNGGYLYSDAYFYGESYNALVINGNAYFNDNSYNFSGGTINGDAIFNTTHYASTVPSNGIMSFENADWTNGEITGTVYGSDNNPITTYEFFGNTVNTGTINGNAIFHDNSHNEGVVNGDIVLDTIYYGDKPVATSTLNISNSVSLAGAVSGTIFASDGVTPINKFNFTNTASNSTTITGDATFSNSSSNYGTINGDAIFNTTSVFTIGTVNGSVTLSGMAQTIYGVNNVINLTKTSNVRDVLYLSSGSVFNVSGLLILNGGDQNNLLTIRSTTPGAKSYINSNNENLNYLRLRDIQNNGSLIDLTNATVFDDGGNVGFTFKANSTPSSRPGITGSFTSPTLPPSRIPAPTTPTVTTNTNNNVSRSTFVGISLDNFINPDIRPLTFKETQNFNIFNRNNNINIGVTNIPNPLAGLKINSSLDGLLKFPVNVIFNLTKFMGVNEDLGIDKNKFIDVFNYLSLKGVQIKNKQDLARFALKPVVLEGNHKLINAYVVKKDNNYINTNLTYDNTLNSVIQVIKLPVNTYINISSNRVKNIKYMNKDFRMDSNIDVLSPEKSGRYIIQSNVLPLVLDVYEPIKETSNNKRSIWQFIKGLFGK